MNPQASILLADGDPASAGMLAAYFEGRGFSVRAAPRGDLALDAVAGDEPDLVIAEAGLPGMGGLELCKRLRAAAYEGPLLMLARSGEDDYDKVLALEFGADAYLAGPVEPRVLLAHVGAILRRLELARSPRREEGLRFGTLVISRPKREVTWAERRIPMSSAEFDLLWLLAANAGDVVPRGRILRELRGLEYAHEDRSVDARLYRLRKRFGDGARVARRIKTVRPHGYMFSVEPW